MIFYIYLDDNILDRSKLKIIRKLKKKFFFFAINYIFIYQFINVSIIKYGQNQGPYSFYILYKLVVKKLIS